MASRQDQSKERNIRSLGIETELQKYLVALVHYSHFQPRMPNEAFLQFTQPALGEGAHRFHQDEYERIIQTKVPTEMMARLILNYYYSPTDGLK